MLVLKFSPWSQNGASHFTSRVAPFAHLGRDYVLQGGTVKAKTSYQDLLGLWKDADSDIPIFKQAKAEYAKLH